jgi:sulfite exporter TauE/SafE
MLFSISRRHSWILSSAAVIWGSIGVLAEKELVVRRWILIWVQALLISGGENVMQGETIEGLERVVKLGSCLKSHVSERGINVERKSSGEINWKKKGVFF